jgi:preprotein translocase subunit SecG
MGFIIGLLTFVLVLTCAALTLLVLMQLPKKDAGAGLAFGGGATDALFGAGSGNVLTKATKYAATTFFVLALVIGMLQSRYHNRSESALIKAVADAPASLPATTPSANSLPGEAPVAAPAAGDFKLETTIPAEPASTPGTNLPATE